MARFEADLQTNLELSRPAAMRLAQLSQLQ